MNKLDPWYQSLLALLVSEDQSFSKSDRTGTGTKSLFGVQFRHDMSDGFPLLTTKKMAFKTMVTELLWFLRGDTNIKYLVDNGCHIWDGDAYKNYSNQVKMEWEDGAINELCEDGFIVEDSNDGKNINYRLLTQEEFIYKIKTDDEFARKWGELGPIYGKQWRSWRVGRGIETTLKTDDGETIYEAGSIYIDQIQKLINELKTNPDSRRLMVSAWNVGELDQMVLPPCHFSWQCYSHEQDGKRYLSLAWNQRSVDVGLGLPFNIASYALLLEIIAKEVNMIPYQLIGNLGDCHLYNNHVEEIKEQINRTPFELPTLKLGHFGSILENISVVDLLDFGIENYQFHPSIKLPLSN
jgi:thymidylate synthase